MPGLPAATDEEIGFQPHPPLSLIGVPDPALPPMVCETIVSQDVIIHFNLGIIIFMSLIKSEDLAEAVRSANEKVPEFMEAMEISDAHSFFVFASKMLKWTPTEGVEAKDMYDMLCLLYFILTRSRFWACRHPSTRSASETVIPRGGFRTLNDCLFRHLKDGMRLIAEKHDERVIAYPADCIYNDSLPNQSIVNIQDRHHRDQGALVDHRQLYCRVATLQSTSRGACGCMRSSTRSTTAASTSPSPVGWSKLRTSRARPISRPTSSAGPFESSSRRPRISRTIQKCKPEAVDLTDYQFLQTRGLVVIENDLLSKVAVLPIGTAMVSLVKLSLVHVGQELKKGDEISTFLFGGSDTICVFESRADLKPKNCSFA
ncbi:hypothetical protein LZ32DRAFT_630627 [Colletotrichum eremochloae]|nr:hypothetical protein LZ32DRAFT_630627 [Colletotrichum eremochloae]